MIQNVRYLDLDNFEVQNASCGPHGLLLSLSGIFLTIISISVKNDRVEKIQYILFVRETPASLKTKYKARQNTLYALAGGRGVSGVASRSCSESWLRRGDTSLCFFNQLGLQRGTGARRNSDPCVH